MNSQFSAKRILARLSILICTAQAQAGYSVHTEVDTQNGRKVFTWTVSNQDESPGLSSFVLEVPAEIKLLAFTVPPPYSHTQSIAAWKMKETAEAYIDPHDQRVIFPAPKQGMKWLSWEAVEPCSVYPGGTSVKFSVTTDAEADSAAVNSYAVSYTPDLDPHYYRAWQGSVTGPSTSARRAGDLSKSLPNLQTYSVFALPEKATVGVATPGVSDTTPMGSVSLHVGITIRGIIGRTYAIEYIEDLSGTKAWQPLASIKLSSIQQIWYDPRPALRHGGYYRVVPQPEK